MLSKYAVVTYLISSKLIRLAPTLFDLRLISIFFLHLIYFDLVRLDTETLLFGHRDVVVWTQRRCCLDTETLLFGHRDVVVWTQRRCCLDTETLLFGHRDVVLVSVNFPQ